MRSIRPKLTYANVIATIALFGVLAGGGAYAAQKIGPKDIGKNAVRAKHIKKKQVKTKHLANRSVTPAKLRNRVRWARVGVVGGDAAIVAGSGGMTIVDGANLGVNHINVGADVSNAGLLVTPLAAPASSSVATASDCSQPGASCEPQYDGNPRIVKVVTAAASTGNPNVNPTAYHLAIVP